MRSSELVAKINEFIRVYGDLQIKIALTDSDDYVEPHVVFVEAHVVPQASQYLIIGTGE